MDQFEDIFTPPESPGWGIGTTTIRRPTRDSIDDETMQKVRTQLFMNQLNDAERGNVDTPEQTGATGQNWWYRRISRINSTSSTPLKV